MFHLFSQRCLSILLFACVCIISGCGGGQKNIIPNFGLDLGTLGGITSRAYAINNNGEVVGESLDVDNHWRPFIWTLADGMQELNTGGYPGSEARDINDFGQVVGTNADNSGDPHHAFLWTPGLGVLDLGTLPDATTSQAYAINNACHVVGASGGYAFVWTPNDGMIKLNNPQDQMQTVATDINNYDHIAGYYFDPPHGMGIFVWTAGTGMVKLGKFGYYSITAQAINDAGEIVGEAVIQDLSTNPHLPFKWSALNGMLVMDKFCDGLAKASGINNNGVAVGQSIDEQSRTMACYWTPNGQITNLGALGGEHSEAYDINDAGQVVGIASTPTHGHAVLWQIP